MDKSFINLYLKFFFVLTPFFVTSVFLTMTQDFSSRQRKMTALRVTIAVIVICLVLLFFGNFIFKVFGITIDAFRIGAGALLFLSAVSLVRGSSVAQEKETSYDIAVVPLAIPVIVGPATVGVLLIMGAETTSADMMFKAIFALISAIFTVGLLLYISGLLDRWLGKRGLLIMSKVTGLILASMAAQMIFTGIRHFLK
jgi:multiple antibiotic resistance protein